MGASPERLEISFILPAHNESENIDSIARRALAVLASRFERFELIIVDDGSDDATAQRAEALRSEFPQTRLLRHEGRRGYGAALKTGIQQARGELVFFTDSDGQFDVGELSLLLDKIGRFDIVAGYRVRRRDPLGRAVLAWGWGLLARLLFGLRFKDLNCAFKLFRRRVFDEIPIESVGAFVNTEILIRAKRHGFVWTQVPVTHYPRRAGRQSGASLRVILKALAELWRFWRQWR